MVEDRMFLIGITIKGVIYILHLEIIQKIIKLEWQMFQNTKNVGGRASCQDNYDTFYGMRVGQFLTWTSVLCSSYYHDLEVAKDSGRNLVSEKYLHMMEYTFPEEYNSLKKLLPRMDDGKKKLADDICNEMVKQTVILRKNFPKVSGAGRLLYSTEDTPYATSIQTYQRGELYTYSIETLTELQKLLNTLNESGVSFARTILENTVNYYGYSSLEDAEKNCR
jgi:hypothetical protein